MRETCVRRRKANAREWGVCLSTCAHDGAQEGARKIKTVRHGIHSVDGCLWAGLTPSLSEMSTHFFELLDAQVTRPFCLAFAALSKLHLRPVPAALAVLALGRTWNATG